MEKIVIENMNGVLICEAPLSAVLENDSKKIKLSTEKLANVLSKALQPKENIEIEEPVHEAIDVNYVTEVEEQPVHIEPVYEEPRVEETPIIVHDSFVKTAKPSIEETHPYSGYRGVTSSVPDIKSVSNTLNIDTKIEKLKKEAAEADKDSIVGKVLLSGVSKIEQVEREISNLDERNMKISGIIEELMTKKNLAQRDNKALENEMSKTMKIDLTKIQDAIALDAARNINESIIILYGIKSDSDRTIDDIEDKIVVQKQEKASVAESKKSKENELYEICREIEDNKVKAGECMKRSSELESLKQKHEREEEKIQSGISELYSSLSLIDEEPPKKVASISNPLDRDPFATIRQEENNDEIGIRTVSRR